MNKKNSKKQNSIINKIKKKKQNKKVKPKRLLILLLSIFFCFVLLISRLAYLQFINGSYLKEKAYNQQSINRIISPKRGTIYDSTGKKLAISSQVDTITINPSKLKAKTDEQTKKNQEIIAKGLSEIFNLDYTEVYNKVTSDSSVETIIKKVDQDKVNKLQNWMKENNIYVGINIDEDSKRSYPYNNLASHLIGFCGTDNNGIEGLELKWDSVLTGTPGKIVSSKDASQEEIPDATQTYIAAENGSDLVLSIDVNIQTIIEKYLSEAVTTNKCTRGGTAIAMNPSTGDILAMANYPNYNLNTPFTPNTDNLLKSWDNLSSTDKNTALQKMWRNKAVSDAYEPGSTFKLITAAVALEENLISTDHEGDFVCKGYEEVNGIKISCWRKNPHGYQSLRTALGNSCNPAFMQLGKKIGASTLYKYYSAFGLFEKTGAALASETTGIFHKLENVKSVELATMSFGQRITITPLQLITAVSAIANNGTLVQPRIVKQIVNSDTGVITNIDPVEVRQVISKETSSTMRNLMESVVTKGTGNKAQVSGYSIGGKTGTSEPSPGKENEGYVASYVAISPTENPEIVLLVALYDPQGTSHQGGTVVGPVVAQMLSEILPYMGLTSDNIKTTTTSSSTNTTSTVPDVRNRTLAEAEKILKNSGFEVNYSVVGDKNTLLVKDQVPSSGISLLNKSKIILYTEENDVRVSVTVPDLTGKTLSQAKEDLWNKNLNISASNSGSKIISQTPTAGSSVEEGSVITVKFK